MVKASRLEKIFNALDTNKNGTLERADFVLGAERVASLSKASKGTHAHDAIHANYETLWQDISVADADHDGKVTKEEGIAHFKKVLGGAKSFDEFPSYWQANVDISFKASDSNGNGVVSKEEYPNLRY